MSRMKKKPAPPEQAASPPAEEVQGGSIDAQEVEHFSKLAQEWWDPRGKFKPLHKFNPLRVEYIRDTLGRRYERDIGADKPLAGIDIIDIGCGGGLLCEPLARLGGTVTGVDPSRSNIAIAQDHAAKSGLEIAYRVTSAEALVKKAEQFDVVLAMEVIEHVANVDEFLGTCARLVKPGGLLLVSTINRTFKALAFAIVGAEYILRWLPRGTHHFDKFVTPHEISVALDHTNLKLLELQGTIFNPLFMRWQLSRDLNVNYMALAERPRG